MKLLLSPTKTMAFDDHGLALGIPRFEREAGQLVVALKQLDLPSVKALFKTSEALIQKTFDQIRGFETAPAAPALFAFRGEAFKTLNPMEFTRDELDFSQSCLLIFSGLYGLVRPLDEVRPYRLDVSTPFKLDGQGLAPFWKERLIPWVGSLLSPEEMILNLASKEYASLLIGAPFKDRIITLQFREREKGKLKNLSVRAKQARGAVARAVIRQGITDPGKVKALTVDGYAYDRELSRPLEWFFVR